MALVAAWAAAEPVEPLEAALAADVLAAELVAGAAVAELALACSAAALAADVLAAELVAGAAVAELALACSAAVPAADVLAAELVVDAAVAELACSVPAGRLAAGESAAGLAVEPVAGAWAAAFLVWPQADWPAVDCDWAARFAAPRLVAELSWAVARQAQGAELERGAQELQRRPACSAEWVALPRRQPACRD